MQRQEAKPIRSYKDLLVWQKGMDIVEVVYILTSLFPNDEKFGLISQMRRAAVSIPSNIAEGRGRSTRKDFANFLHITLGSVAELETHVEVSKRLGFAANDSCKAIESLLSEETAMLTRMIITLKKDAPVLKSSNL